MISSPIGPSIYFYNSANLVLLCLANASSVGSSVTFEDLLIRTLDSYIEEDSALVEKAAIINILRSLSKKAICLSSNYRLLLS